MNLFAEPLETCVPIGQPVNHVVHCLAQAVRSHSTAALAADHDFVVEFLSVPQAVSLMFLFGYFLVVRLSPIEAKGSVHGGSFHKN